MCTEEHHQAEPLHDERRLAGDRICVVTTTLEKLSLGPTATASARVIVRRYLKTIVRYR